MLEIDVPLVGLNGVSDVHIESPRLVPPAFGYLQSSPEYFMKRLLAAGTGSIYCLGKAFRLGELGQRHYPEFTLLEWYRPGWDEHELMDEVFHLLLEVGVEKVGVEKVSVENTSHEYIKKTYGEVFETETGINPHLGEISALRSLAARLANRDFSGEGRDTCLDLIFSLQIEPVLPAGVMFICDYPACQAALAELGVDTNGVKVARRFEVFLDKIELANGYYELTDAVELRQRFEEDNKKRLQLGRLTVDPDERLLAAMAAGLPPCAGVALGVDRLLMNLLGVKDIAEVLPFADYRQGSP